MEQMIHDYGLFIIYVLAVVWMIWSLHMIPRGPRTNLTPEGGPTIWQMPGWYFLLAVLVLIGYLIFKTCGVAR